MMVTRISLIVAVSYMTLTIVGKFKPKAVSPPPGGNSAYERGGDARRLAYGCKFRKYGVLGKTPSCLAVKVSFRVAREKI